ncbi:MAG: EamA family transporter [Pseudomonadota bacterium]
MFKESWVVYALGSAFFAALTAVFGKIGVTGLNSNLATLIRTVFLRNEWQKLDLVSTRSWVFLVLSGIATGLSWLSYYRALQLGPASKVAPIDKLSVALVIVLSVIFIGEKLTWAVALGGMLILAGTIVIIMF